MTYNVLARRPFSLVHDLIDLDNRFETLLGQRRDIPVEVVSTANGLTIFAEIPGVHKDEISIDYANRVITVSVEKKPNAEKVDGHYYYSELKAGKLSRSIQLNADIEFGKADAEYTNGVLTIQLPKPSVSTESKIQIR